MSPKVYRFFFHYNKKEKKMSVHYRGTCYLTEHVRCRVPCSTKWNEKQPRVVMQGYAQGIVGGRRAMVIY